MIVSSFNPETEYLEKTFLSSGCLKGSTLLPVKNNHYFSDNDYVLVGEMGGEKSEVVKVSSVASDGLSITTGELKFNHNSDTPLYRLEYDSVRFYRRDSRSAAPSLVKTMALDIDNADGITRWDDTAATKNHWYQYAWYNSHTQEESELSDPVQSSGYARETLGAIIDGVVRRVRDTSYTVLSFDEYVDIANEVGDDLITQAMRPYVFLRRSKSLTIAAGADSLNLTDLIEDFWKLDRVEVACGSGSDARYREVSLLNVERFYGHYRGKDTPAADSITDIAFDSETNSLRFTPAARTTRTDAVIVHYYKMFSELKTAGDVVETPNPTIYRYKLMAEYYSAKAEVDRQWMPLAQKYEEKYGNEIVKMQRVNRRDVGTPQSFRPARAYRRRRYSL